MAPQTFSFTVQINHRGGLSTHVWRADYRNGGRQRPVALWTSSGITAAQLLAELGELGDRVLLELEAEVGPDQPGLFPSLSLVVSDGRHYQEDDHNHR